MGVVAWWRVFPAGRFGKTSLPWSTKHLPCPASAADDDGGTDFYGVVEALGVARGETDAAGGGGVAGDIAGVEAVGAGEAHEIGHGHAFEMAAGRAAAFADVDVLFDDLSIADVVAVEG